MTLTKATTLLGIAFLATAVSALGLEFKLLDTGTGHGVPTFTAQPNGFKLELNNSDKSNYAVIVADFSQKADTSAKDLVFNYKGAASNGRSNFSVTLSYMDGQGKWHSKSIGGNLTTNSEFKEMRLSLEKKLGFPKGEFNFVQMKFGFGGGAQGTTSVLEVKDARFADHVPVAEPPPAPPKPQAAPAAKPQAQTDASRFENFNFRLLDTGTGHGKSEFTSINHNSFRMTINNTDAGNYGVVCADFKYSGSAQQKLVFRLKGAPTNGNANLSVNLLYVDGGKWHSRSCQHIPTRSGDFNRIVLALDRDFQFGDARYNFVQLKFGFGGGAKGTVSHLEIEDVRLINSEDLNSGSGGEFDPIIVPFKPVAPKKQGGVLVYFDFDNEDLLGIVQNSNNKPRQDNVDPNSFAKQLLNGAEGLIQQVDSPMDAEVIISSRVTPGGDTHAIRNAVVGGGARLFIFGEPQDETMTSLAALQLTKRSLTGLPQREKLTVAEGLWSNGGEAPLQVQYYDAKLASDDAKVLLHFDNNVPFAARRGQVYHFASGVANQLDGVSPVFYDRGLLKLILSVVKASPAAIDQREKALVASAKAASDAKISEILKEAGISQKELPKWQLGMSENNIGRFGWMIGEPLLHCMISGDLAISNDSGVFRLFSGATRAFPLIGWTRKVLKGDVRFLRADDVLADWEGEGVVEYTIQLPFDAAWKGKPLFFEAREGIDDTDETYLNGVKIGGIGTDTPNYWVAPRRYAIPEKLIKWDGLNTFRVVVTNIRGNASFNSAKPQLVLGGGRAPKLSVPKADWIGKRYRVEDEDKNCYELEFSLLSPFIRYSFPQAQILTLAQENLCEYALYHTAEGCKILKVTADSPVVYDLKRDGKLAKPWILMFRNGKSRPFMVVFQHNPTRVKANLRGSLLESFAMDWPQGAGEVFAGWPYGIETLDTSSWINGLDKATAAKINLSGEAALTYPVGCDEIFTLNRKAGTVDILNRFRYRAPSDDWNTPARPVVSLPPLATWMLRRKMLVSNVGKLKDLQITTNLGITLGKEGSVIQYSLPLPDGEDFIPVGVADNEFFPDANRRFADGVNYSAGGATPFARWTPQQPYGPGKGNKNICPFRWNFGLGGALHGAFCIDSENRAKLENRVRIRFMEPIELFQHKYFARHRTEPFSGIEYPILFNAFFPNTTRFASGYGSNCNYGDANEASILVGWIAQQLNDFCGQREAIRRNWPFFRYGLKHQLAIDDYGFMAGSCRETGIGAWVDMLNAEYSGMLYYARLARECGDEALAEQCLYRAAKRMLPTLARLFPGDEVEKVYPDAKGRSYQIVGFSDIGPSLMFFPTTSGNFYCATDLFDFSEGFTGGLIALYHRYGAAQIREHLDKRTWPNLMEAPKKVTYMDYIGPFGAFGSSQQALTYARASMKSSRIMHDWPDMMRALGLGCVLWQQHGKISFRRLENLRVQQALLDPQSKLLTIKCTAEKDSLMELKSEKMPKSILRNGKKVKAAGNAQDGYRLPLVEGEQLFQLQY